MDCLACFAVCALLSTACVVLWGRLPLKICCVSYVCLGCPWIYLAKATLRYRMCLVVGIVVSTASDEGVKVVMHQLNYVVYNMLRAMFLTEQTRLRWVEWSLVSKLHPIRIKRTRSFRTQTLNFLAREGALPIKVRAPGRPSHWETRDTNSRYPHRACPQARPVPHTFTCQMSCVYIYIYIYIYI